MGSSLGTLFRISTFGESHGPGLGVVIDGCPAGVRLDRVAVAAALARRRPGQSSLVSPRNEADEVEWLSGLENDHTLGSPIALLVRNTNARSSDYRELATAYRPSHAEYTYDAKYGRHAAAGGGRASARETVARVAAGAIAEQLLAQLGVELVAWVESVEDLVASVDEHTVTRAMVDASPTRCPEPAIANAIATRIEDVRKAGDSVGGVVRAVARGVPAGLGEPVMDKLEAELAKAMLSLPAARGFEIGSGFAGTRMRGSVHNDELYLNAEGRVRTHTNHAGGIVGGISNGEPILIRVAFKPTATIMRPQPTVSVTGEATILQPRGRHDPCVLPRAVPIVEAMFALVLLDQVLQQRARQSWPQVSPPP